MGIDYLWTKRNFIPLPVPCCIEVRIRFSKAEPVTVFIFPNFSIHSPLSPSFTLSQCSHVPPRVVRLSRGPPFSCVLGAHLPLACASFPTSVFTKCPDHIILHLNNSHLATFQYLFSGRSPFSCLTFLLFFETNQSGQIRKM